MLFPNVIVIYKKLHNTKNSLKIHNTIYSKLKDLIMKDNKKNNYVIRTFFRKSFNNFTLITVFLFTITEN